MGPIKRSYVVPVTMTDERLVSVEATSKAEAVEKVKAGRYRKLGRSLGRGFLLVGEARAADDA